MIITDDVKLIDAFLEKYQLTISEDAACEILTLLPLEKALEILDRCPDDVFAPLKYFTAACRRESAKISADADEIPFDDGRGRDLLSPEMLEFRKEYYERWPEAAYRDGVLERPKPTKEDVGEGNRLGQLREIYLNSVRELKRSPESWKPPEKLLELFPLELLNRLPFNVKRAILYGWFLAQAENAEN